MRLRLYDLGNSFTQYKSSFKVNGYKILGIDACKREWIEMIYGKGRIVLTEIVKKSGLKMGLKRGENGV